MNADVGDGIAPGVGRVVQAGKGGDLAAIEKVLLDVIDARFNAAFFVAFADAAGANLERIMAGHVGIAGMGHDVAVAGVFEDGDFGVIDHDFGRNATEEGKGMALASEEMFEAFLEREFEVEHAAVTEHHDEGGKPALGIADADQTARSEVDLGAFPGSEGQGQEGGLTRRSHRPDMIGKDGILAGIAFGFEELKQLNGAVIVAPQEVADAGLVRVKLAGRRRSGGALVTVFLDPGGDGFFGELQTACDLADGQFIVLIKSSDLIKDKIVNHEAGDFRLIDRSGCRWE